MSNHKRDASAGSTAAKSTAPNLSTRRRSSGAPNSPRRPQSPTARGPDIRLQRIYDHANHLPGYRVLVDRLWPRGVQRQDAGLDEWAKDLAPSAELRRWYGHDPRRFDDFARRYRAELARPPGSDAIANLRIVAGKRRVILLTATRDIEHSGARVLHDHLLAGHE